MAWTIRNYEPIYVDEVDEVSMDCLMCDYYEDGKCKKHGDCYWDEVWNISENRILGERYDEYMGFDCDNYDPYDPFEN